MAFTRNVNWDEFYFLSHIHAHLDGRLDRPLQTVFVHAFGWLAHVSDHEVDQITVARLTMTALLGGTTFAIFYIASAVTENRTAASVATIAFLTSGFVLPHGASFRADPIAAAGLMAALAIMMTGRIGAWQILTIAALSALSLLVTVKAALYLPAYLAALLWRADDPRIVLRICFSGLLALALAGALFSLHSTSIAPAPGAEASTNMSDALNTALLETRPFPRAHEAILWAALSFPALLLAGTGLVSPMTARKRIVLVGLALPLLFSVVFYRNAFPYFFPFIVPPLMIVVAIGAARVRQKNVLGILVVTMLGTGAWQAIKALSEDSQLQRETIAEVHRLFPEPVAYIDHNAMISSFPRSLFFMSTWGVESYRKAGRPVIAGYIARDAPPFLLANRWALQFAMMAPDAEDSRLMLLPEDRRVLRDTYVHYSGAIWLAGKDAVLDSGETRVELTIPGRYRLESPVTISIDGEEVTPNEVIDVVDEVLVRGPENTPIRLVWDTGQPPRPNALPQGALYAGF
ncbi:MAG: hypothetical protein AAF762_04270 [Pseudomonadota bacterium]